METCKLLLKAADIDKMAGERKVHFLNPNAVRINKSLGDAIDLNHIGVHIIYVEPGKFCTLFNICAVPMQLGVQVDAICTLWYMGKTPTNQLSISLPKYENKVSN